MIQAGQVVVEGREEWMLGRETLPRDAKSLPVGAGTASKEALILADHPKAVEKPDAELAVQ